MTRSTRCAAVCAIRRPLQEGQTPRPLHEKATTKPCPHDVQRARPNPKQRMPQVRYDRSSRSTCAETGCSTTDRFSSQPSRCSATLLVERRLLRPASLVAAGTRRAAVWADFRPRRRRGECGDHGRTGQGREQWSHVRYCGDTADASDPHQIPPANLCLSSGDVSAQEAYHARTCGRHRLQLQSRIPRLAFCGPRFLAPPVGRPCRLATLSGRGGGHRHGPAAASRCGAGEERRERPPPRCRARERLDRRPTPPRPSP
jgi:hypothetical protein